MAKRFTDTEKWKHDWFLKLTVTQKVLWGFLCDSCDPVGVWPVSLTLASFFIGEEVTNDDLRVLGDRIMFISEDKLWIPGFIKFQYKSLSSKNNAHRGMMRSIIASIGHLPLSGDSLEVVETFNRLLSEGQETLDRGSTDPTGKGKGKGKGKDSKEECEEKLEQPPELEFHPLAKLWNENCGQLSKVREVSRGRLKHISARLKDCPDLEVWTAVIKTIASSDWCNARHPKNQGWKSSFDWLLHPDTRVKVLEGFYDNKASSNVVDY